ncbi:MAG: hypothetical protein C0615_08045 [Desulfuromonas sp.]|nr:MAG: hypothetical protein C0615_08045 [Desulfuromonas sp.]
MNESIKRQVSLLRRFSLNFVKGIGVSPLLGRFVGPRILMNSIPKSGTNLLEQTLIHFPLLHRGGVRTLRSWNEPTREMLERVNRIGKGEFLTAHLPAHKELMSVLSKTDVKVILMIRDPRDIVVSNFNYVLKVDKTHPTYEYLHSLPDDKSRLMATICGVDGLITPIAEALKLYEPWLRFENTHVVRFEDLIGEQGGGSLQGQLKTVSDLASFLEVQLSEQKLQHICSKIYNSRSITFRKAQIGGWKDVFCREHLAAYSRSVDGLASLYGY